MRTGLVALSASVLLGGCNAQNAKETGGAVGTLLGVVVGAAIGGNNNMGAAGGALVGGVVGFLAGSMVGQVIDEVDRAKQQEATQAALNGDGATVYWASPKTPGTVYGRTEIVSTVTVPVGTSETSGTVTVPVNSKELQPVYCLPSNGKPYRLEAQRCPSNGSVVEISRDRYLAMVPEAAQQPIHQPEPMRVADPTRIRPEKTGKMQTASIPTETPSVTPVSMPASAPMETVCRVAREVIWVEGKEQVDQVEYCRAPGVSGWSKKAA
jgi:surface antigen